MYSTSSPQSRKNERRGPNSIHGHAARRQHLGIGKTVRKRVGGLLHRRRSGFADVITADRDRIPAWHVARGEFHHVAEKTQRRLDRENGFVLRLHFLEDIGLNRPAELRHDVGTEAPFRRRDVHRHDDRRRAADRHRGGEIRRAQIEAVVEPDHVLDGVDRHAALADLAEDAGRVAVDAVKRRPVERGAEALRALVRAQENGIARSCLPRASRPENRRVGSSACCGFAPFLLPFFFDFPLWPFFP